MIQFIDARMSSTELYLAYLQYKARFHQLEVSPFRNWLKFFEEIK